MTATAIVGRLVCRQPLDHELIQEGLDCIGRAPPAWDAQGSVDFPYWFFGTIAKSHAAGESWRKWCEALDGAVRGSQRHDADTCAHGSWDPVDPWGAEGGRVYSTAVNALMLEVRQQYPKAIGVR